MPITRVHIGNGIVAFESDEIEPQDAVHFDDPFGNADLHCDAKPGRNYNGDSDYFDRVIRWFDIATDFPTSAAG